MNNNMKCPFCQQELQETYDGKQFWCSNYKDPTHPINLQGTKELWQELIRTRKALKIAVDLLKRIDETRSGVKENLHATNGRTLNAGNGFCWATIDDIHNALEKIKTQEQKDVK